MRAAATLSALLASAVCAAAMPLSAPALEPRNGGYVTAKELTPALPFKFAFNGTTSYLRFGSVQNTQDGGIVTSVEQEDSFKFVAVSSSYLGTTADFPNGMSNKTSSYFGVLVSQNTGKCLYGQETPMFPADSYPWVARACSWNDDDSQTLQTFRALFHSGVSGGSVRAQPGQPVSATITFTGPYPDMPTTLYYGASNQTGVLLYNTMYDYGTLTLGK